MSGMTEHQALDRIKRAVAEAGSMRKFGDYAGLSGAYVCNVLNGKSPPSDRILHAAGVKRVITYHEIKR